MEKKLYALFDFHLFMKSAKLQAVIDSVHARYAATMLSDDDVAMVAAAGAKQAAPEKTDSGDKRNVFP